MSDRELWYCKAPAGTLPVFVDQVNAPTGTGFETRIIPHCIQQFLDSYGGNNDRYYNVPMNSYAWYRWLTVAGVKSPIFAILPLSTTFNAALGQGARSCRVQYVADWGTFASVTHTLSNVDGYSTDIPGMLTINIGDQVVIYPIDGVLGFDTFY